MPQIRTESQRATSRTNGSKSRGPTSRKGKRISSQNSLKHGLHADVLLLPDESRDSFLALSANFFDVLRPTNDLEDLYVQRMVEAEWRLVRIRDYETVALMVQISAEGAHPEIPIDDKIWINKAARGAAAFGRVHANGSILQTSQMRYLREFKEAQTQLFRLRENATRWRIPQYEPGDLIENNQSTPLPKSEPEPAPLPATEHGSSPSSDPAIPDADETSGIVQPSNAILPQAEVINSNVSTPVPPANRITPLLILLSAALLSASALYAETAPFTASKRCAECHAEIYRSYARTPMALSAGNTVDPSPLATVTNSSFQHQPSAFTYSAGRDTLGIFFAFKNLKQAATDSINRRLPYFIGSGSAAQAYAINVDGFLYEAPVTWYSRTKAWGLSPGYEDYSYPFLTRAVVLRCLECHASGVQQIAGTQNAYASPPFLEGGVACERCHGPGQSHIASHIEKTKSKTPGPTDIVNPATLSPARRDSVCAQCHLTGAVTIEKPGQEHRSFIAGQKLEDHFVTFTRANASTRTRVTSHVEDLAQSKCKRISGDALWCGTCHDPHSVPAPQAKANWFREKCLTCHAVADCTAAQVARTATGDSCIACHMPPNAAADAQHVVFTDHSIPRSPLLHAFEKPSPNAPLIPFGKANASPRDLGLAYAITAIREQNSVDSEQAFQLLKQALAADPLDPPVLSYLADLYKKRADDKTAIDLYQKLLVANPFESTAPVALGGYAMEAGNYNEAIKLWSSALRHNPALLLVRANLAIALIQMKRPPEARTVLDEALKFNPGFTAARELLKQIAPE